MLQSKFNIVLITYVVVSGFSDVCIGFYDVDSKVMRVYMNRRNLETAFT